MSSKKIISFQGRPGAYSDLACREVCPDSETLPCRTFEDTLSAVHEGKAHMALIPIDNSIAGRVADIHHLLPNSNLHIIAEHFQPIHHHLLAVKGAKLGDVKIVRSHIHALSQCRNFLKKHGIRPIVHVDTAGGAEDIAKNALKEEAAIASSLAGEVYNLDSLSGNIEDISHNTTRFLLMSPQPVMPPVSDEMVVTSFVFRVRNLPAALFKAMGGFATNGVNMTKLESYLVDGTFTAAQFYADIEGHPSDKSVILAMEELKFFSEEVKILGVYPAHPYRQEMESIKTEKFSHE